MLSNKEKLKSFVNEFRSLLFQNYGIKKVEEYHKEKFTSNRWDLLWDEYLYEDLGYENWAKVRKFFIEILEKDELKDFDLEDKTNLIYLVARGWETSEIVNWFSQELPLASFAEQDINRKNFVELAKTASQLIDIELDAAKCQFATSFKKLGELTSETEKILLDFFKFGDNYTKRCTLQTLATLRYPKTYSLIENSWEKEDEEFYRITCLSIIDEFIDNEALLDKYITLASIDNREHISAYVEKLKEKNNNR